MYPNINQEFQTILRDCEILMSYPIGKIFTSDTPSGKEKKHEERCTNIVDSFYSIESKPHQSIRNLLHDIESTLLLFSDTITSELLINSMGRLQAQYEEHKKVVQKACKLEEVLLNYYSVLQDTSDWYSRVLLSVKTKTNTSLYKELDKKYKELYYNSYKDEKRLIREV